MPEPTPTHPDPTGLLLPARVTLIIAATVVMVGMTPCLGLLLWPALLLCLPPAVLGGIGLARSRKAPDDAPLNPAPFLGALIGSAALLVLAVARLILGMGVA